MVNSQEVLVSSYLKKKPTLSTTALSKKLEGNDQEHPQPSGSHHGHLYSPPLRWPRHGDHVYWCVLRRGQFSYYKTKDEKEAINVLPRKDILNYRVLKNDKTLLVYTKDKTLRFKCEPKILDLWEEGFKKLMEERELKVDTRFADENTNQHAIIDENEDEDDEDDDEGELYLEFAHVSPTTPDNNGSTLGSKISEEDRKFFEKYDPQKPEHVIMSTTLYARIKTRFNRRKWKKFKVELSNRCIKLYSIKTGNLKNQFDLVNVIDCVEYESKDLQPVFSLISVNHRIKFKAKTEQLMIDWIVNIKSVILASRKTVSK